MDRGERRMIFPRWNIKQHLLCVCKSTSTIVLVVAMAHDSTKNHCCVSLAPWSANYISIWNLHFFLWIFLPSAIKNLLFLRDFHASENFISRYSRRVVGIRRKKKLLTLQPRANNSANKENIRAHQRTRREHREHREHFENIENI